MDESKRDFEIARVQKEIISNAQNQIATELLIRTACHLERYTHWRAQPLCYSAKTQFALLLNSSRLSPKKPKQNKLQNAKLAGVGKETVRKVEKILELAQAVNNDYDDAAAADSDNVRVQVKHHEYAVTPKVAQFQIEFRRQIQQANLRATRERCRFQLKFRKQTRQ